MNVDTNALLTVLGMWLSTGRHRVIGAVVLLVVLAAGYVLGRMAVAVVVVVWCDARRGLGWLRGRYGRRAPAADPGPGPGPGIEDEPWCDVTPPDFGRLVAPYEPRRRGRVIRPGRRP